MKQTMQEREPSNQKQILNIQNFTSEHLLQVFIEFKPIIFTQILPPFRSFWVVLFTARVSGTIIEPWR